MPRKFFSSVGLLSLVSLLAIIVTRPQLRAMPAPAVKTIVSGTILDPNGVPYAGGTIDATLLPTGTTPTVAGVGQIDGYVQPVSIDTNGNFTLPLYCNSAGGGCTPISPSGTQWQFKVTNRGAQPPVGFGGISFTITATITGATQSLTSALHAAAPQLVVFGGATAGCSASGAAGNLLLIAGTGSGCTNTNELNYNSGSDTLIFQAATQEFIASTALAFGNIVGDSVNVIPGTVNLISTGFVSVTTPSGLNINQSPSSGSSALLVVPAVASNVAPNVWLGAGIGPNWGLGTVLGMIQNAGYTGDYIEIFDPNANRTVFKVGSTGALTLGDGLGGVGNNGVLNLNGTDGVAASITAPNTAGTRANPMVFSNAISVPSCSGCGVALASSVNITPVTVNGPGTGLQNLQSSALGTATENTLGKTFRFHTGGTMLTASGKIEFTFGIGTGSGNPALSGFTPGTPGSTYDWSLDGTCSTTTAGATGAMLCAGSVSFGGAPSNTSLDSSISPFNFTITNANLTGALTLQMQVLFSAASGSNTATENVLTVEQLN